MAYKIKTAPTTEPVTLDEAKAHLQVTTIDDDILIESLIKTARQQVENYTNRQLLSATWELFIDSFPSGLIYLEKSPVISVTSIEYYAEKDDSERTEFDSEKYIVDNSNCPARLSPIVGESWPSVINQLSAVKIEFEAGYASAVDVPAPIKSAILLIVGNLYENRGDEGHRMMPKTIEYLLDPYVAFVFV